jgi:undecaprenyl-diphosphatase
VTGLQAVVLGVVQGVTEFLPISSTAHLRIVPALLGWDDPGAAFSAVIQLGSLAAVTGYFLTDLLRMLRASAVALRDRSRPPEPAARQLLYLIVATIPIGLGGMLFKHAIEGSLRALSVIAAAQILVALGLAVVERVARHSRDLEDVRMSDALTIGTAQALALVPGVSRSGITLLAAMAIGLRREAAARFSFLLSVPAIAGAGIVELPKVLHARDVSGSALALGVVSAAVTSYLAIAWLLRFLRTRTTRPFIIYRIALGLLIFGLLAAGKLH